MSRICLDARKLDDFGIGTYIRKLLTALAEAGRDHHYWVLVSPSGRQFVEQLGPRVHPLTERAPVYSIREQATVSWHLHRLRPDLYHATHYVLPASLPCPAVITIHDVIHLLYPSFLRSRWAGLYARFMISRSLRLGQRIIAVSESTRRDLVDLFHPAGDRLRVIYNGVDDVFGQPRARDEIADRLARLGVDCPYLLFVGNPKPHKNLGNLLRAWARVAGDAPDHQLVCAGDREGAQARYRHLAAKLGVADRVLFLGHVDEEDLVALYQGAQVFLYPTLYEGFGLPVVEAMAAGTPVITSNSSALREIAEGSAELVDPLDIESMARAMRRCTTSAEHRRELRRRGLERADTFRWSECAAATLAVYDEVLRPSASAAAVRG